MEYPTRHAVITGFLSRTKDRFHEYNEELGFEERLALAAGLDGFSGVEIVYPYEVPGADECRRLLSSHHLEVAAVNVNVKADPDFRNGGLTSTQKRTREKAVRFIVEAKEYAKAIGADKVTCCPLGDGYEFAFDCDYQTMWGHLVDTIGEAARHLPEVPLHIEYKPAETRGRCFVDTASKALCLVREIDSASLGVTIDYGHSKFAGEHPAEALSLIAASGVPYYIHINDNDGRWDWDYAAGSHNFIEYVEFLFYAKRYSYSDFFTSDTSPTRWDIRHTFEANARMTNRIWSTLDTIDTDELSRLMADRDSVGVLEFTATHLLGLGR